MIEKGMNILGAHIDSPRLDIKQNPLYEDTDLAYLDTHYYGGVKKYQWVTLPLAIHGVVVKKDGSVAEVNIGEDEDDPIVYITDLLIHLAGKQLQKTAAEVIEGENLDILIGSRPLKDEKDENKKQTTSITSDEEYKLGEILEHKIFGQGVVVGMDDKDLTIAFSNKYGIKFIFLFVFFIFIIPSFLTIP